MARLRNESSGRTVTLGAATLIGRSSACTLALDGARASGRHATLIWGEGGWALRDLGSRNGTTVDGAQLASGGRVAVSAGARVAFAGDVWVLVDDGPPVAVAVAADGQRRRAADGLLALPDEDDPEVTVYAAARGRWVAEQDGEPQWVSDGDAVSAGGRRWALELPPSTPGGGTQVTAGVEGGARSLEAMTRLTLALSRDEETVEVSVAFLGAPVALPPRSFGYLLVVLARARARDAAEPEAEQGWMYAEEVCREVGIDKRRLNVEVHRFRKMLAEMGVEGAAGVFERRPHTRQIRLGVGCAEVVPLG